MATQAGFIINPSTFLEHNLVLMGMEGYGAAGIKLFRLKKVAR